MISHDLLSSAHLGIKKQTKNGQVYDRMLKSMYEDVRSVRKEKHANGFKWLPHGKNRRGNNG